MTKLRASPDSTDAHGGMIVQRPRAGDAVGCSLRDIYSSDSRLPGEMTSLLRNLDAIRQH